ncbi:MAG: ATPase domain-containing protein [Candidatus ainarchaeum sp.]|nr:ATPase domain-containing protein [Candidatus ainarchaeum sp.]
MNLFGKRAEEKQKAKKSLKKEDIASEIEHEPVSIREKHRIIKPNEAREEKQFELLPIRVDAFDKLISSHGLERGSIVLIAGGAGTGKTTFCFQSIFESALAGEKCIYLSFEEEPEKIKKHMKTNYGWDVAPLEKKGNFAIIKFDPLKVAKTVEAMLERQTGELMIEVAELELPFTPDRLVIDSLSALSVTFESEQKFRRYVKELFDMLESYNCVSFVISETTQDPTVYSPQGIDEFLADVVLVFYNIKIRNKRMNAAEILKIRSAKQVKGLIPYTIGEEGIKLLSSTSTDLEQ